MLGRKNVGENIQFGQVLNYYNYFLQTTINTNGQEVELTFGVNTITLVLRGGGRAPVQQWTVHSSFQVDIL